MQTCICCFPLSVLCASMQYFLHCRCITTAFVTGSVEPDIMWWVNRIPWPGDPGRPVTLAYLSSCALAAWLCGLAWCELGCPAAALNSRCGT